MADDSSWIRAAWAAGQQAWPGVPLAEAQMVAFWSGREAVPPEGASDAFILAAIVARVPGAAGVFARSVEPALREALRKTALAPEEIDDVLQRLWTDLLIDQGEGVRLAEWRGQGQLLAFLRVSAVRLALKVKRAQQRFVNDDELFERQTSHLNPELSYLKASYREAFREAFQEALDAMPSRDQLLLRQHLIDGLSIDELAGLYRVHRATTARWIVAAKEALIQRTRRRFFASVALPPEEQEGVISLVRSRLDETIRRRLQLAG